MRYFVAVAEEGGFGRAAERIGIVQSAVSQQIRRLERELGAVLFDRSTRRVRLSAAGERLLPEARLVLAAAERVREVAAGISEGAVGVLRLGTIHGDRLYRALTALAETRPGLQVRLQRLPVVERLAAVREGRLDAALVRAVVEAPGLRLVPLRTDPLYAAVPARHPLAERPRLGLGDLAELPLRLAARERNPPFHDLVTDALRDAGVTAVPGPAFTSLRETLAEIAVGTPSWTVFYDVSGLPPAPGVVIRPLAGPAVVTSLAVREGEPSAGLRELVTVVKRCFPDEGAL
ncbi:HTH-type transcriptional regulator BenM [Streptomyces sp. enrichment culture]